MTEFATVSIRDLPETSGIVESKLVMNGQPVEYGEALFAVRAV